MILPISKSFRTLKTRIECVQIAPFRLMLSDEILQTRLEEEKREAAKPKKIPGSEMFLPDLSGIAEGSQVRPDETTTAKEADASAECDIESLISYLSIFDKRCEWVAEMKRNRENTIIM